jgi:hypothetical protein
MRQNNLSLLFLRLLLPAYGIHENLPQSPPGRDIYDEAQQCFLLPNDQIAPCLEGKEATKIL